MKNVCFVDTNVFLYAQDPSHPEKQQRARAWLSELARKDLFVISPQVMNEFIHAALRKMTHIPLGELLTFVEQMALWCRAETTSETALQGLSVHRRYGFAFYDATLIASALMSGCDIFLSEDMSHEQRIGRLQIINPFAVAPFELLAN